MSAIVSLLIDRRTVFNTNNVKYENTIATSSSYIPADRMDGKGSGPGNTDSHGTLGYMLQ